MITWNNITVNQFIELSSTPSSEFENELDFQQFQLSVLTNKGIDEIGDLPYSEFVKQYAEATKLLSTAPPINRYKSKIKLSGIDFNLMDFNSLSVGEAIDMENYITGGFIENLKIILAIVYRRLIPSSEPLLYPSEFEPYGNYIFVRSNLFGDVPIVDVWGVIHNYLERRLIIFEKYEGLFNSNEDIEDEEEKNKLIEELSSQEKKAYLDDKKTEEVISKWGWDIFILRLSNYDLTKVDTILNLNFIQALNHLSMKKELNIPESFG